MYKGVVVPKWMETVNRSLPLVIFLGSVIGGFAAFKVDIAEIKFVQEVQATQISSHEKTISDNTKIISLIPGIKEDIKEIKVDVHNIQDYLLKKEN